MLMAWRTEYEVPEHLVQAFEQRRRKLLLAAIFVKIVILGAMLCFLQ
jgi:hypothetical protein